MMRDVLFAATAASTACLFIGLAVPVLGNIGLTGLTLTFGAVLVEIARVTMPGKGGR